MQSVSDDDVRKRLLEKPRFELAAKGLFRLGRRYIFWCHSKIGPEVAGSRLNAKHNNCAVAVLGKIFGRPGPSSLGRQQRLSEITIEPIKNLGPGQDLGGLPPGPSLKQPL